MLEENARVVSVHGDTAVVEVERQSACGSCQTKGVCGTSLIATLFPSRRLTFQVANPDGMVSGQQVVIGLQEQALQTASLLIYLLPLFGLIGGAFVGRLLGASFAPAWIELFSIMLGVLGMGIAFVLLKSMTAKMASNKNFQARILRAKTVGFFEEKQ